MADSPQVFPDLKSTFVLTIFGATGHLTHTKLIPGLLSLYNKKMLPDEFFIIGFSRREWSDEDFRNSFEELSGLKGWEGFSKHLHYQLGKFEQEEDYTKLDKKLKEIDGKMGSCASRFYYLATPPKNYSEILDHLVSTKLSEGCGHAGHSWTRVIIEKPFGRDLETAKELDKKLANYFDEKQIFRVDHYLGKETVQNMLTFRFANGIFEPIWKSEYIDHVQITWAEKKGIEGRGEFFEQVGMLRDVVQNHLLQLLAAIAMEQPKSFTKESIRDARADAIKAIRRLKPEDVDNFVVRGQHSGHRTENNVNQLSDTETFVAMKLFVDTPRFENIPFYLRAGKSIEKDRIDISVVFKQTCHILFKEYGCPEIGNVITIRIQPDEGISIRIIGKTPGPKLKLGEINMKFSYKDEFGTAGIDAYEKILLDIFSGDQMLFNRSDELESSWELVTAILKNWENKKPDFPNYKPGSWGPKGSEELIEKDGRKWL